MQKQQSKAQSYGQEHQEWHGDTGEDYQEEWHEHGEVGNWHKAHENWREGDVRRDWDEEHGGETQGWRDADDYHDDDDLHRGSDRQTSRNGTSQSEYHDQHYAAEENWQNDQEYYQEKKESSSESRKTATSKTGTGRTTHFGFAEDDDYYEHADDEQYGEGYEVDYGGEDLQHRSFTISVVRENTLTAGKWEKIDTWDVSSDRGNDENDDYYTGDLNWNENDRGARINAMVEKKNHVRGVAGTKTDAKKSTNGSTKIASRGVDVTAESSNSPRANQTCVVSNLTVYCSGLRASKRYYVLMRDAEDSVVQLKTDPARYVVQENIEYGGSIGFKDWHGNFVMQEKSVMDLEVSILQSTDDTEVYRGSLKVPLNNSTEEVELRSPTAAKDEPAKGVASVLPPFVHFKFVDASL